MKLELLDCLSEYCVLSSIYLLIGSDIFPLCCISGKNVLYPKAWTFVQTVNNVYHTLVVKFLFHFEKKKLHSKA